MSDQPQLSPLDQLAAMGQQQTTPSQQTTQPQVSPLDQLAAMKPNTPLQDGPNQEEQELLAKNPDYKFLAKDSRFPNRQPGVYPMGEGNEWRNDPNGPMANNTQMPVDPHLLKHSLQGAAFGAAGAGSALLGPFAEPVVAAVTSHLDKLKTIVDYAEKIGLRGLEYEGARKLYKDLAGDKK